MADSVDTSSRDVTGGSQATVTDETKTTTEKPKRKPPQVKAITAHVSLSWVNIERAIANGTASQGLKYVQEALKENGAYTGKLDGVFGPQSKRALTKMARAHDVTEQQVITLLGFDVH